MKPEAVAQARDKLRKAEAAVGKLRAAGNFDAAESAWLDFLMAAASIYSKLEKGAKDSGPGEAWFGRMRHERKTDELLSYIHHARNAEEHGIAAITERKQGYLSIKGDAIIDGGFGPGQVLKIQPINASPEKPFSMEWQHAHIKLVAVHDDRFNDTFQPPTSHRGKPIANNAVEAVANLALVYLRELIDLGAEYIPPLRR